MIYNKYNNGIRSLNVPEIYDESYTINEDTLFEFECILETNKNIDILCEELLLEKFSFVDFFENLKRIIVEGLKKFFKFAKSILTSFSRVITDNKTFADKYRHAIYQGFDILAMSDANDNDEIIGVAYDHNAIDKFSKNISVTKVNASFKKIINYAKDYINDPVDRDYFSTVRHDIISSILDDNKIYSYETPEEISKHIEDACIIDKNANLIKSYVYGNNICDVLRSATDKDIKEEFNRVKEVSSVCIDRIDEFQEILIKKDEDSGHAYDMVTGRQVFSDLSLHVKFIQSVCHACSITLSHIRFDELKQTRKFANECVKAFEKNKQGA